MSDFFKRIGWSWPRSWRSLSGGLVLATAVILLLALVLSPDHPDDQLDSWVVCCDTSASLSPDERTALLASAQALAAKLPKRSDQVTWIEFGKTARTVPGLPNKLATEPGSDFDGAMLLATEIIRTGRRPGKIALLSDGTGLATADHWATQVRDLQIPVFVWYPPRPTGDLQLISLQAPTTVAVGVKIPLVVRYHSTWQGKAHLQWQVNGRPYGTMGAEIAMAKNGLITWEGEPLSVPGLVRFQVAAHGDSRTENNLALATTLVIAPNQILLLGNRPDAPLQRALATQNLPVVRLPWEALAAWDNLPAAERLQALAHYPAIIADIPPLNLFSKEAHLWEAYLQNGGALLIIQPPELDLPFVPATFPKKTPPKPPEKKEEPAPEPIKKDKIQADVTLRSVAIIFVLDTSGSMEGEKLLLAKEATMQAIARLWPQDWVGVMAFDTQTKWVVLPAQGTDHNWIQRRIATIEAGGGTLITQALLKAAQAIYQIPAHIKHIVLLSDGQDLDLLARHQIQPLLEGIRSSNITVSTIGVGKDFDAVLMPLISRLGGGEFYYTGDFQEIPAVMVRDVDRLLSFRQVKPDQESPNHQKPLAIPEKILPAETAKPPDTPPTEIIASFPVAKVGNGPLLSPFDKFPGVPDYQIGQTKPGASLELTVGQDPLLCHWPWGLGRVMVWSSSGAHWARWPHYPRFWARLVRFAQGHIAPAVSFSLSWEPKANNTVVVWLQGVPGLEPMPANLSIHSSVPFGQVEENLWRAAITVPKVGVWEEITVKVWPTAKRHGDEPLAHLATAYGIAYHDEVADLTLGNAALEKLAQASGGGLLPQDTPRFVQSDHSLPQEKGRIWPAWTGRLLLWLAWVGWVALGWSLLASAR